MVETNPRKVLKILRDEGWAQDEFDLHEDGSVTFNLPVDWSRAGISEVPYKIREVRGEFNISQNSITTLKGGPDEVYGQFYCNETAITSLKFIPKFIDGDAYFLSNKIPPIECVPALLSVVIGQIYLGKRELFEILNTGRIAGKMNRELIPGKINQLRELDVLQ
jgi:hypothetical protein